MRIAGMADRILVNSHYTATMFRSVFYEAASDRLSWHKDGRLHQQTGQGRSAGWVSAPHRLWRWIVLIIALIRSRPTLFSLNRFEPKKNVVLAIEAFSLALKSGKVPEDLRLVVAGGYDERVDSCIYTLRHLQRTAEDHSLSHSTTDMSAQILFLTNLSQDQKLALMKAENTKALLYTPSFEHLGIVPLEAMACGLPVIAVDNGGPMETIIDGETGYLRASNKQEWSEAIVSLVKQSLEDREKMGKAGQQRIKDYFDVKVLARGFERAARDVLQAVDEGQLPDIWAETATLRIAFGAVMGLLCILSIGAMLKYGRGKELTRMKIKPNPRRVRQR